MSTQDPNQFAELRKPFLKRFETLIGQDKFKASTPLDEAAKTAILCSDVLARAETMVDRLESLRDWEYSEGYPYPIGIHLENIWDDAQKECSDEDDCVSGLTGCYRWVAVNKKYIKGPDGPHGGRVIESRSPRFCWQSHDPGPQPKAACHNHLCRQATATAQEK